MVDVRKVVTSFLRFQGKILILQRSTKVGTYQGKWGAVSGYIEGNEDPDIRAIIEIKEEVGLSKDQITLVKKGAPLQILDEGKGITWIVHPYLFEVSTDQIQLDWEHQKCQWIAPEDLKNFQTVPELNKTFERVKKP